MKTIESNGGAEKCMKSDKVLAELLELRWRLQGETEKDNAAPIDEGYGYGLGSRSRSRSYQASGGRLYSHSSTLAQPSSSMAQGYSSYSRSGERGDSYPINPRNSSENVPYAVPQTAPQTSYAPRSKSYNAPYTSSFGTNIHPSMHQPRPRSHSVVAQAPSTQYRATGTFDSRPLEGVVPGDSASPAIYLDLDPLKQELSEDVDQVLDKNMVIFVRKLDVQKKQLLLEMAVIVRTQADRVIRAVDSGPYERIEDEVYFVLGPIHFSKSTHQDIQTIWKDMVYYVLLPRYMLYMLNPSRAGAPASRREHLCSPYKHISQKNITTWTPCKSFWRPAVRRTYRIFEKLNQLQT
jgi:hypothetical protein